MKELLYCIFLSWPLLTINAQKPVVVAQEGAWCWFADPRALHYENDEGTINATYIGYIDVHGNVKATQYDWLTQRQTDVLVRSFFQPDDHNNPTFLVLPNGRVMIFYTRHTDEPRIWYRISQKPGDITALGEEKSLLTEHNTTYPSPFILSDDPTSIYLCWRGINWHPTIARITMPDTNDDCHFDYGPKQIVQSTGARPYAKYQSNGKDRIYLCYTTGHPDNEQPNWLYFNVVDINHGNGPVLRDIKGRELCQVSDGPFRVSKTDDYAAACPATIVDRSEGVRNWVWQIALDSMEHPVVAYTHIDEEKTTHDYWYARWNGNTWTTSLIAPAGHAFHQNWNATERCYSGGMAIAPTHPTNLYLSIPTDNGQYERNGIYEIWHYALSADGCIISKEQLTKDSPKNNARPYIIPTASVGTGPVPARTALKGHLSSPSEQERLTWLHGDYFYWMVNRHYPKGYPTAIHARLPWQGKPYTDGFEELKPQKDAVVLAPDQKITFTLHQDPTKYQGQLFAIKLSASGHKGTKELTYAIDHDQHPVVTIGDKCFRSSNILLTSDAWATGSNGTNGDSHPTKMSTWTLTVTYDGHHLTTLRNGFVDQVIPANSLP